MSVRERVRERPHSVHDLTSTPSTRCPPFAEIRKTGWPAMNIPFQFCTSEQDLIKLIRRLKICPFIEDGKWDGKTLLTPKGRTSLETNQGYFGEFLQELLDKGFEFPKLTLRKTKPKRCSFPGCDETQNLEPHHVLYRPALVKLLCHEHHLGATACNTNAAFKKHAKLSNKHRLYIWGKYLKGEITPVFDAHVLAWINQ